MYDSNLYTRHAVAVAEESKLLSFLSTSFIGLLSLRQGHNVARLDTHAPGSLRHVVRLKTSWPGHSMVMLSSRSGVNL